MFNLIGKRSSRGWPAISPPVRVSRREHRHRPSTDQAATPGQPEDPRHTGRLAAHAGVGGHHPGEGTGPRIPVAEAAGDRALRHDRRTGPGREDQPILRIAGAAADACTPA